jgi:hypothetical protein
LEDHLHRHARVGSWVLIRETWYKSMLVGRIEHLVITFKAYALNCGSLLHIGKKTIINGYHTSPTQDTQIWREAG